MILFPLFLTDLISRLHFIVWIFCIQEWISTDLLHYLHVSHGRKRSICQTVKCLKVNVNQWQPFCSFQASFSLSLCMPPLPEFFSHFHYPCLWSHFCPKETRDSSLWSPLLRTARQLSCLDLGTGCMREYSTPFLFTTYGVNSSLNNQSKKAIKSII